jgi:hypothetical protein
LRYVLVLEAEWQKERECVRDQIRERARERERKSAEICQMVRRVGKLPL